MIQPELLPPVHGLNDLLDDLGTAALCLPWAIIFLAFGPFSQRVSAFISGSRHFRLSAEALTPSPSPIRWARVASDSPRSRMIFP